MNTLKMIGPVKISLWLVVIYITWVFMSGANHLLLLTPEAMGKYFSYKYFIILHITAGGGALISGPPQFWARFRIKYPILHRCNGYLYLLSVVGAASSALVLAFTTAYEVNWSYAFSLQIWVSVWISASAIAFIAAFQKRFESHKEWMVRSYLSTLAFMISGLLLKTPVVLSLGSFADISPSFFWFGWAVPLYLYQIFLCVKCPTRRITE